MSCHVVIYCVWSLAVLERPVANTCYGRASHITKLPHFHHLRCNLFLVTYILPAVPKQLPITFRFCFTPAIRHMTYLIPSHSLFILLWIRGDKQKLTFANGKGRWWIIRPQRPRYVFHLASCNLFVFLRITLLGFNSDFTKGIRVDLGIPFSVVPVMDGFQLLWLPDKPLSSRLP